MKNGTLNFVGEIDYANDFSPEKEIVLRNGSSLEFLKEIPKEAIKLIITSPPYNVGKEYETKQSIEKYLQEQEPIIDELVRVLDSTGSLCWQVGNYVESGEIFPLDMYYYPMFKSKGLQLRNRIIWHFGHGLHASKRFSGRYETLLWFTKSDTYTFNLDSIRVPSKYPGKTHFKGEKRGLPSGNPLGKNPSDIWEFVAQEWEKEMWNIPNVKANHPEKTIHPCQFPIELVERCVLALTNENDWVLDPYAGVGSVAVAALKHKRKGAGVEKESEYVEVTKERIFDLLNGTLKMRPLGQEVHVPTGKEKVSQVPKEWLKESSSL
ncbi:MAG TPA: site-specific DNA-methyltransferase [Bacteroidia bacterium]|nr:site-specific DNA-methyltransferase [Bacteroidia bacterium]HNU34503.1 site-specific DNA-methyltransferase [Bacteroidia bacterium]